MVKPHPKHLSLQPLISPLLYLYFCKTSDFFFNLLPDSFLLHGLHFLSTGNYAVDNLFLFIGQVWTRTGTWFHCPAAPVNTFPFFKTAFIIYDSQKRGDTFFTKCVNSLFLITVSKTTHQREAWDIKKSIVIVILKIGFCV